jgi:hypothetical protein
MLSSKVITTTIIFFQKKYPPPFQKKYPPRKKDPTKKELVPHFKDHNVLASLVVPQKLLHALFLPKSCGVLFSPSQFSLYFHVSLSTAQMSMGVRTFTAPS